MADPALAKVIRQIESFGGNPQAIRFEPGVYSWEVNVFNRTATVQNIASIHQCTQATAHVLFSMSFGMYQEMGFNLWDRSQMLCKDTFYDFVADDDAQHAAFAGYLTFHDIDYTLADMLADQAKMDHWVKIWNGPGAVPGYEAEIRKYAASP